MTTFQERLKELRTAKNLSQQEIANKLDVSRVAYTNWENGNREPSYDNLINLSILLETSTDYLLGISDINRET